jgi:type II secretory pathway pseudopilin PulG
MSRQLIQVRFASHPFRISDFGFRIRRRPLIRNPQSAIRNRACCSSGFTLVEAAISTVIVAVMFVAALNTVGAARVAQHKASLVGRGRMFAESLMAEICLQSYQEPGATWVFGREAGESDTIRTAYDDVDDYHGWTESPPTAKDGTALPNSADWRRAVTVEWVNALDPTQVSGTETGAKRITVVAAFRNVPQATVVAVRTAY